MARRSDEDVQAELEPLADGEVPGAVRVAAAVAAIVALFNLASLFAGAEVQGKDPNAGGVIGLSAALLVAAAFLWRGSYWVVLGFQALLALTLIAAGMSLVFASNLYALVLCLAIIVLGGTLFWKLVRAMARIQMPERPNSLNRHG